MIPFNYHHLYYFYEIARTGSVSKACEKLRLAQPTVSAQLKQLESYLGVRLFDRQGKRLLLTDEGRYALSYAKEIFDTGSEMIDNLKDRGPRGRLHIQIGASSFLPKAYVDAMLGFLLRVEPNVHLLVREDRPEKMLEDLRSHLLDLVLTDAPLSPSAEDDIENHLVGRLPVLFCAHPDVAKKIGPLPKGLNGIPLILPTSQSQIYHAVQEYLVRHKVTPKILGEIQDVEVVRRLVLAKHGVAPLNRFTIDRAPSRDRLSVLGRSSSQGIFENVFILTKKRKKSHPLVPALLRDFRL